MGLTITSTYKCQTCYDNHDGEFWEKPMHHEITVKNGVIVCLHCDTPITSDLEVM